MNAGGRDGGRGVSDPRLPDRPSGTERSVSAETLGVVRRVIAEYQEIPEERVQLDSRLLEDLEIDSLGALEIVFELEEAFDIEVPEEQAFLFRTVRAVCEAIEGLLAAGRTE